VGLWIVIPDNQNLTLGESIMQAYFIKCVNLSLGTEAISSRLFYFYDQVREIVDTLNDKNDGYSYFIHQANI
jgi:hypothetical protein